MLLSAQHTQIIRSTRGQSPTLLVDMKLELLVIWCISGKRHHNPFKTCIHTLAILHVSLTYSADSSSLDTLPSMHGIV